uniref:E3 ubiquitin-protein ligase HEL2-like n=1 Tax=Erigeron canadensis TaxID=72917 RepID=UPI001CB8F1A3|nr:E3 ubiquitin-protein ligase HEL2-like [Erigeron canadensis]
MDDTCAVCADSLEWVAYGICGHKDVCSTCVARLRFICSDNCCCICKTESKVIFVTKALGDYTKNINDFSVFSSEPKEGRSGRYWYHEDTQAFFDDLDQYKMIKAMCRLSCSVCDKAEVGNAGNGSKRKARFHNIGQLKGHLFHQHNLCMCSLCLEGRKVFICEQKLYSKAQLRQHINTGDSEVDGTESERGGFQGHPLCEFCRTPFYGDNELYTHMNTEHFNCHICRRQNPGKYEYYKNYDDLENHFRGEHFLCEDEACLSKKFIVFTSEAEMKRHNAQEHGGHMSRSQRNAALQIPTSFTYRRSNEQDNRRGRRNTFQRDFSEAELSEAIEASFQTADANARYPEASSSIVSDHADANGFDPLIQSLEALDTDAETPSRYLNAVSHGPRNTPLEESAFPPLSTVASASAQRPDGLPRNTMADNLRRQNKKKINVLNTGHAWPAAARASNNQSSSSSVSRPANTGSSSVSRPANTGSLVIPGQRKSTVNPIQVLAPPAVASSSSSTWKSTSKISHSTSAPNLVDTGSGSDFPPVSASDFPPVSALQMRTAPVNAPSTKSVQEVYAANKSMVEKIREGLNHDQDKYADFKQVSAEYRQGVINAETYLVYVDQFGLSDLVPDLARLLPDPGKEKELMAVYNANQAVSGLNRNVNGPKGNGRNNKGKSVSAGENSSTNKLTNSILSTVRELQSNYRLDEEVETLSKDGYRVANKGKSKAEVDDRASPGVQLVLKPPKNEGGSGGGGDAGEGKSKQKQKKMSKFLRKRLGNGSMASILDSTSSNGVVDSTEADGAPNGKQDLDPNGLPVRGVWRNGGGHKLIVKDQKRP